MISINSRDPGGGSIIRTTANWEIPVTGTIRYTNYLEKIWYFDGTSKLNPYPNKYSYQTYAFTTSGGKQGVKINGASGIGTSSGMDGHFYEKK
jgi:hypothetical protein